MMAGMKKLVPSNTSSDIIIALTKSAGNANSASTVATNIPHTVKGMRMRVMPRVLACRIVTT